MAASLEQATDRHHSDELNAAYRPSLCSFVVGWTRHGTSFASAAKRIAASRSISGHQRRVRMGRVAAQSLVGSR